jgi:hypothetical protein
MVPFLETFLADPLLEIESEVGPYFSHYNMKNNNEKMMQSSTKSCWFFDNSQIQVVPSNQVNLVSLGMPKVAKNRILNIGTKLKFTAAPPLGFQIPTFFFLKQL